MMRPLLTGLATLTMLAVLAMAAFPAAAAAAPPDGRSFTASVGINTHLGYSNTVYWQQWPMIRDRLKELGVSHLRDGTLAANYPNVIGPTVAARYRELNAAGIKGNLLIGHEQRHDPSESPTTLADRIRWIKTNSLTPFVIGLESTNEYPIGVDGPNDWNHDAAAIQSLWDMTCDIYSRVNADPELADKPVIAPSEGPPAYDDIWWFHVQYNRGNMTRCIDKGNLHPYPGTDPPHLRKGRDLDWEKAWASYISGDKPQWITEDGYWNAGNLSVSETIAGIYIPRMFTETFRRGYERTQGYELIDLNTSSSQVIDRYGLLRTDGTRKPAYSKLKTLLALLKGTVSASTLGYGISCTSGCHSPIRHVLLERDGVSYIAAWSESRAPQANQAINLTLTDAPGRVDIYTLDSTTPARTITDGSKTLSTQATDEVRVFKITPPAATAPCATAPTAG